MHDVVFAMHEFRPELDRVPREGAAGEDASPDAIAGLHANGGDSGADQLAHGEHSSGPGADHDDIGTNRLPAWTTPMSLWRLLHKEPDEFLFAR
jgi:hypothetical protein